MKIPNPVYSFVHQFLFNQSRIIKKPAIGLTDPRLEPLPRPGGGASLLSSAAFSLATSGVLSLVPTEYHRRKGEACNSIGTA